METIHKLFIHGEDEEEWTEIGGVLHMNYAVPAELWAEPSRPSYLEVRLCYSFEVGLTAEAKAFFGYVLLVYAAMEYAHLWRN